MSLYDETTSVLINPEQLRVAISAIEEGVNRSKKQSISMQKHI